MDDPKKRKEGENFITLSTKYYYGGQTSEKQPSRLV
jgi:hypothetical protein